MSVFGEIYGRKQAPQGGFWRPAAPFAQVLTND